MNYFILMPGNMLNILFFIMLAVSSSAFCVELEGQLHTIEEKNREKESALENKLPDVSQTGQVKNNDEKLKLSETEVGGKQDCDETNCNEQQFAHRINTPLGARISDALTRQDREAAVDILDHDPVLLNDKMNLLFVAGRKKEAADVAFLLMERSDQDEQLYEQAAPILFDSSRASGFMSTFYAFESYNSIESEIFTTGHQVGGFTFDLAVYKETRNNVDLALLASVSDEKGGVIAIHQAGDSYINTLKIQHSESLNSQTGVRFNHLQQIGLRLKLDTQLAYNQTAAENPAMRLIGRSSYLALEASYAMDGENQFDLQGIHNQYQTIDEQPLGSGNLFAATVRHEFSSVHPALRGHITGTLNQYQVSDQVITGKAASIIPVADAKNAAFFMPDDVYEVATYASIGDATEAKLPSRDWEYMCELGIFSNRATGIGWRGSAGIAGRVIGADRLQLFVRYDQAPSGQGFSSFAAGLGYHLHY